MDVLSIVNTGMAVINDVKGFSRSIKQAQTLRNRLQTKLSSTQSILEDLKKLVEDLGRVDNNGSSDPSAYVNSGSEGIQSLLKLKGIENQLESLGKSFDDIRERLKSRGNSTDTKLKKIGNTIKQMSRREKEEEKLQGFSEDLSDIKTNASVLYQTISIWLQNLQRRDEDGRERKRIRLETERLDREEEARRKESKRRRKESKRRCKESERRRQETEKQELERLARLRREEEVHREETERRRQEIKKQELEKLEKQRQELIEWLKPYDYNSKHQSSTQLRQEDTCGWLLENEMFQDWRSDSPSNFLWLYGIPGSGKTILFSKVVDDLEKLANTTVVYHYCDFMNADSIIPSTILRSIFVQLLLRTDMDWLAEFEDLSRAKKDGKSPPSGLQELASHIQRASKFHQRTIIAIDALDECQRESSDRRSLLHYIDLIRKDSLSLFVTSRDEYDIHMAFHDLPSISTGGMNTGIELDIQRFILSELNERPRLLKLPVGLRSRVMRTLAENSKGLFHWVHCQIVAIDDCLTEEAITAALRSLPQDMNQTYERILKKILNQGPHAAEMARRILLWLVGATRPLHILELCEAIMIEPESTRLNEGYRVIDPMNILRACGSLIQSFSSSGFDSSSRTRSLEGMLEQNLCDELFPKQDVFQNHRTTYIRLAHYTVKEFLQTAHLEDSRLSVYHLPPAIANHDIAVLILTYLTLDVFYDLEISLWNNSRHLSLYDFFPGDNFYENRGLSKFIGRYKTGMLFSYGWTNWESHLLQSIDSESLYGLLRRFFEKRLGQLRRNVRILREVDVTMDVDNKYIYGLLLFAMGNGIKWLIQLLLNDSPISDHLNLCNSRSPRIMSMEKGGENAVDVLVQAGAYLNALSWHQRALSAAASRGRLELSWVLIRAGVDPNAVNESGRTALHEAASRGHLEVSTMLIQAGVDPNAIDESGRTALHDAASRGNLEVSTMLIQAGVDPNVVDWHGRTALHYATSKCRWEVSTMLVQAGADPNVVDQDGRTALHNATSKCHLKNSKVLIQASADTLSKNKSGKTPLHIAIDLHSKPIVEYLLSNGAPLADLGLLYDEQVQWAQELPWYSQLALREFDYSAPVDEEVDVIPSRSVLEVRWILRKVLRLPSEVASLILDLSEYWAHSFVWRKDQIATSGYVDVSYLSVKLRSKGSGSLRKVVFITKSYEETKYSNPDKEPAYYGYNSRFEVTVTSPTGKPSLEPRLIQFNASDSPISRVHVNTWEYEDHADWMNVIYPGDLISVHVKGALLGDNVVNFVRMDIYCAW